MVRRRVRRFLVLLTALCAAAGVVPLASAPAGAGSLSAAAYYLFDDSPWYEFAPGGAPTRNAPLGVVSLLGVKKGNRYELDITQVVSFVSEDTPLMTRLDFYGAPGRSSVMTGGVEFTLRPIPGETAQGTLVERSSEGTATSPEIWEEADEDFADANIKYTDFGVKLTLEPLGSYRKLLKDPLTTVGLDLFTGEPGTNVQPSTRVSVGDLFGTKPGLFPQQGTSIAADGTPQPWITQPVADDFFKWRVRGVAKAADPQHVTVDIGKYRMDATQIRLLVGREFDPLPAGSTFPSYDLLLFGPKDERVRSRSGDAFRSVEVGPVMISAKGKGKFALEFIEELRAGYASVGVVVPGETDAVLLATTYRYKF
jgi:hypothetical protein